MVKGSSLAWSRRPVANNVLNRGGLRSTGVGFSHFLSGPNVGSGGKSFWLNTAGVEKEGRWVLFRFEGLVDGRDEWGAGGGLQGSGLSTR